MRGTLEMTAVADADHCPDLPVLVHELQREFEDLTGGALHSDKQWA
jgi:hypothetical protein